MQRDSSLIREWVEALRYGEYEQAQGLLKDGDGKRMCAEGVLCDLMVQRHPDHYQWMRRDSSLSKGRPRSFWYLKRLTDDFRSDSTDSQISVFKHYPPAEVYEAVGLNHDGEIPSGDPFFHAGFGFLYTSVAALNDAGFEFDKIADIIEDSLLVEDRRG